MCKSENKMQGSNEGCKRPEKEDVNGSKNDEKGDNKKKKQKKKRVREDSNEGIVENNRANLKGEVGDFAGAEHCNKNVNWNVEKRNEKKEEKKKRRRRRENDKTVSGSGHRLQDNHFEDVEVNVQSRVNNKCGNVIPHEKEVETAEGDSSGDLVGKVGKKKRKREKNKGGHDKGASQQDSTQLTESGKQDRENQNREYLDKSDEGWERKITKKAEKKKSKRKDRNDSNAPMVGTLAKENNQRRADPTLNEQEDNYVKNGKTKGKSKKATPVENGPQDSKTGRSPKKVRFSANIEVFPSSDVVNSGTGKKNDTLLRGKRFSKEEDEIVKQAVYNYIEENCLGDEGLTMVLNCRSHPEIKNCWKEIGAAIPYRPYTAVYARAHILFERSEDRKWSEEEKEMVRKLYEQHGPKWKEMAEELGKHRWHVKDTWRRIKVANRKKGRWSQDEYQNLFVLVNMDLRMKFLEEKKSKHGMLRDNIPWCAISDKLSTRSDANCCLKWYHQLTSPLVAEGKWSDSDDYRLINALYQLDASCIEDVDWDNLLDHRSGDVCRKRWNQMVLHIGEHGSETFVEQVELLANRYCPDLLDARVAWDNKPVVT